MVVAIISDGGVPISGEIVWAKGDGGCDGTGMREGRKSVAWKCCLKKKEIQFENN